MSRKHGVAAAVASSVAQTGNIDAKAQAMLLVVLAGAGVDYASLTQFERMLWTQAYKLGHGQGMVDGVNRAREAIK